MHCGSLPHTALYLTLLSASSRVWYQFASWRMKLAPSPMAPYLSDEERRTAFKCVKIDGVSHPKEGDVPYESYDIPFRSLAEQGTLRNKHFFNFNYKASPECPNWFDCACFRAHRDAWEEALHCTVSPKNSMEKWLTSRRL